MENMPMDENEDLGKNYSCLRRLKEYRGYITAGIELWRLKIELNVCKRCELRKFLGFCVIKDELEEIQTKAVESQKYLEKRGPGYGHPSYSRAGQAIVKKDYEGDLGGGTPKNALEVPGIVHQ